MLLLALVLASTPVTDEAHGFHFVVPDGFEPFPHFRATPTKLYAYGKNLGTPDAISFTIDSLEGPAGVGSPSCNLLMHSIDRTIGSPHLEKWSGLELSGLRMLMTHLFGEVLVLCTDVPLEPIGVSLRASGKPDNEAQIHAAFGSVLSSLGGNHDTGNSRWFAGGAVLIILVAALLSRGLRTGRRGN